MKPNRTDFILDFETLGTNRIFCPVVNVAYRTFTWDRFLENPYTLDELIHDSQFEKVNIQEQVKNYGYSFTKEDLKWWENQGPDVINQLKLSERDVTLRKFGEKLIDFFIKSDKIEYWWSRANSFDPVILERVMEDVGLLPALNQHLMHWRVRDMRTHIDAKFDYTTQSGFIPISDEKFWKSKIVMHDPRCDIAADVMRLQAIYRAENDLEQASGK